MTSAGIEETFMSAAVATNPVGCGKAALHSRMAFMVSRTMGRLRRSPSWGGVVGCGERQRWVGVGWVVPGSEIKR